jgi:hypothetical protein
VLISLKESPSKSPQSISFVGGFAFEFRIVAGHVAFETVRFQARFLPNAMLETRA